MMIKSRKTITRLSQPLKHYHVQTIHVDDKEDNEDVENDDDDHTDCKFDYALIGCTATSDKPYVVSMELSKSQDALILKQPKRSPLVFRTVVLFLVMFCPISTPGLDPWEALYVHFPIPKTFNREECTCNPVRYFAILSTQRSGSGWFETLLNSHMNISSNGEIFGAKYRRSNASAVVETLDRVYSLDWLSSSSKNACSAAVGFKWMLNQAEILATYKPKINATMLLHDLRVGEAKFARAVRYFGNARHIVLYYEDIVSNRTKLNDVQKFLGVPYMELKSGQVKIHKGPLQEQIENWDEIQRVLRGTTYERFLHADYEL
ncbi:uncharacterized protein LOC124909612 [Impatiens glandulifera]|uniref:uncharacterized protein LOC124909612 n=1 Tax=Impatiens glandulifera TaxID=253017 RepID=UPI001FB1397B|nr:uncharacterized protein LOC124909612 [Impatiens glandulifera]